MMQLKVFVISIIKLSREVDTSDFHVKKYGKGTMRYNPAGPFYLYLHSSGTIHCSFHIIDLLHDICQILVPVLRN